MTRRCSTCRNIIDNCNNKQCPDCVEATVRAAKKLNIFPVELDFSFLSHEHAFADALSDIEFEKGATP